MLAQQNEVSAEYEHDIESVNFRSAFQAQHPYKRRLFDQEGNPNARKPNE